VTNELPEEIVLDEAPSPGGVLELVAYTERGVVWIGVKPKGSPLKQAIGPHAGSREHYVEATASINLTWGVAFGAVSREIKRVEVCNDQGETFDGKIVPLPASTSDEYQAAWAVATSCRNRCDLIGYDDAGRLIDGVMIRPARRDLSPSERLDLLLAHCDNGLRYYTWALKKMPSIPEQADHDREVENSRQALALTLAYIEGADEERTALSAVSSIIQRYSAVVDGEGWEPPFTETGSAGAER
jgi:hypothetical protein